MRIKPASPQHSSGFISIRALSPADAQSYRLCVCWRFTNSLQRSARCQRMNHLSELSASLAEQWSLLLERFKTINLHVVRFSLSSNEHRAYLGAVLPAFRRNGCGRSLVRQAFVGQRTREAFESQLNCCDPTKARFVFTDRLLPPLLDWRDILKAGRFWRTLDDTELTSENDRLW